VDARAAALIDRLGLQPHVEGGYYREIYRSASRVRPTDGRPLRAAVTTIYFLLAAGQESRWHRVTSDEIWHFYDGDPLELSVTPPSRQPVERVTISAVSGPGQLVHMVPAGWWQSARPLGAYTLVGCTVAPGFDFADFSFLPDAEA
jgi:predicted cupin superfamily sugar epimerase